MSLALALLMSVVLPLVSGAQAVLGQQWSNEHGGTGDALAASVVEAALASRCSAATLSAPTTGKPGGSKGDS